MRPSITLLFLLAGLGSCGAVHTSPAPLAAQAGPPGWTDRADLEEGLPPGVRVRVLEDGDAPLRAFCVEVDPGRSGLELRVAMGEGVATVGALAQGIGAPIAVNGGYFGGGRSYSLAVDRGVVLSRPPGALGRAGLTYAATRGAFGVLEDGRLDVAWAHAPGGVVREVPAPPAHRRGAPAALEDPGRRWPVTTAIGAGPVLLESGEPRETWTEEVFFGSGIGAPESRQPRTAVGSTADGRVLLVVVEGRAAGSRGASLPELTAMLRALGAVDAINLDGGGSSALVLGGRRVTALPDGARERPVSTILALAPAAVR